MLRTTSKQVKQKLNDHILSHFTKDYGWNSDNAIDNLKQQVKAMSYGDFAYQNGLEMAQGGTFLIYYREQRDFLGDLLEETEFEREHKYSDDQVFKTYCHLIARQIAELVK
jgi:hypothetical protein